jgi:hypothetical protein
VSGFNETAFRVGVTHLDARVLASQVQIKGVDATADGLQVVFVITGITDTLLRDVVPAMQTTVSSIVKGVREPIEGLDIVSRSALVTTVVLPSGSSSLGTPSPPPRTALPDFLTPSPGPESGGTSSSTGGSNIVLELVIGIVIVVVVGLVGVGVWWRKRRAAASVPNLSNNVPIPAEKEMATVL